MDSTIGLVPLACLLFAAVAALGPPPESAPAAPPVVATDPGLAAEPESQGEAFSAFREPTRLASIHRRVGRASVVPGPSFWQPDHDPSIEWHVPHTSLVSGSGR